MKRKRSPATRAVSARKGKAVAIRDEMLVAAGKAGMATSARILTAAEQPLIGCEVSCPGSDGGSETRIWSSSKELQVHAQSQEVSRGVDRARCAAGARLRPARRAGRAGSRGRRGGVAQARAPGRGRRWAAAS